ncbi:MAG: class I SAM-dependent methyltransferase [Coriobacteriia bacterium]
MSENARPSKSAADYDEFVNWQKRLSRELPFFRDVFEEVGARTVIDVGAGSARHAIEFAAWGLVVDAVDPDEAMLAQAASNVAAAAGRIAEEGGELRVTRGGFGELAKLGLGPVDALICTGNALPHVADHNALREALADFAAVVRPGGVIVLHLLNHARLLAARPRAIPPVVRDTADGGVRVFLRVIGYPEGDALDFDFLTLTRDLSGEWSLTHRRSPHTALPVELLREELQRAGFGDIEAFGGHDRHPLTAEDESVIVVARRGE